MNNTTIRTFNRFELKYIVTLQQAEGFRQDMQPYMSPDLNGTTSGRYRLGNLYYDSPDLRCYQEKENGISVRRKLRIRYYETDELFTEARPVFVEIKQRVNRVTQKRRTILPYYEALQLCNDRLLPDEEGGDKETLDEIYAFVWQYTLRPSMIVRYTRGAFVGKQFDIGLRITFDTSLVCQPYPLRLHEQAIELPILDAGHAIMEIKVNDRIPIWLTQLIGKHNLKMVPFSKYGRSIALCLASPLFYRKNVFAESALDVVSTTHAVFQKQNTEILHRK